MPIKDLKDNFININNSIFKVLSLSNKIYLLPSVIIYPSNICNFKCEMCDFLLHCDRKIKKFMNFDLMKSILDQLNLINPFFFKPRVHFSGFGEPLLYPHFKETIEYCKIKRLKYSVTTNGYLLDKFAEDLVKTNCSHINISIHGPETLHNSITNVNDAYKTVKRGLKILNEYKKKYDSKTPIISINCVINNKNIFQLESIIQDFSEFPINSIVFQHLIFFRKDFENNLPFLIKDKNKLNYLKNFINNRKKYPLNIKFYPRVKIKNIENYYTNLNHKFKLGCLFPWLNIRIYPNGRVGVCEQLFGNLHKNSLKQIINNKSFKSFRKMISKGIFCPYCERCCHRDYY